MTNKRPSGSPTIRASVNVTASSPIGKRRVGLEQPAARPATCARPAQGIPIQNPPFTEPSAHRRFQSFTTHQLTASSTRRRRAGCPRSGAETAARTFGGGDAELVEQTGTRTASAATMASRRCRCELPDPCVQCGPRGERLSVNFGRLPHEGALPALPRRRCNEHATARRRRPPRALPTTHDRARRPKPARREAERRDCADRPGRSSPRTIREQEMLSLDPRRRPAPVKKPRGAPTHDAPRSRRKLLKHRGVLPLGRLRRPNGSGRRTSCDGLARHVQRSAERAPTTIQFDARATCSVGLEPIGKLA